jgi:uncharacterized SAM-binding protein YcdF (DUF218 family)
VDLWHDPLETRHPFLSAQELADLAAGKRGAPPRWVVVLGGGLTEAHGVPAASRLSETSLARLVEGVRLVRELPQAKLLFSVGEANEPEVLADLVVSLGVPRDRLVMEHQTRDTGEQARALAPLLGRDAFILVTSAVHLPRSVRLFQGQGLDPIPQPAGYLGRGRGEFGIYRFLPNSFGLVRSERAWHEYLGLAWNWLSGTYEQRKRPGGRGLTSGLRKPGWQTLQIEKFPSIA